MEFQKQLTALKEKHQWRSLKKLDRQDGGKVVYKGKEYLSFISNDYLGIASNQVLQKAFLKSIDTEFISFGSASSRLLEGHSSSFERLETQIAQDYNKEACIWMNSGYHANIGILSSLPQKGDLILSDKLNHASMVDGLKLSDADFERFRHLDYDHLERILNKHRSNYKQVYIVSEALFSMDGDTCNLQKLVDLKTQFDCHLILDEAHSVGSFGAKGLGLSEFLGLTDKVDVIIAPCGKALGGVGAFIVLPALWKDYLINTCRSFIYTTSLPPINAEWLLYTWKFQLERPDLRELLQESTSYFLSKSKALGIKTFSDTYIQPIIIGNNEECVALADGLLNKGIVVSPIRYPTVPKGTSRLRISLTTNHTKEDIDLLLFHIKQQLDRIKDGATLVK